MNLKTFLRLLLFLSSHLDELVAFIAKIIADWNNEPQRFGADANASTFETLANEFPNVAEACNDMAIMDVGTTTFTGSGAFRELIRFIIENQAEIIALIDLLRKLFKSNG